MTPYQLEESLASRLEKFNGLIVDRPVYFRIRYEVKTWWNEHLAFLPRNVRFETHGYVMKRYGDGSIGTDTIPSRVIREPYKVFMI